MIQVPNQHLKQVQYLLEQSKLGNHLLFDSEKLREVFQNRSAIEPESNILTEEEAYGVEHHIERLLQQPGLLRQRAYLERLDARTFEWVVRTYFNIVENNIVESQGEAH